jgi:flagellar motility protein MotE (MotC chaperone)
VVARAPSPGERALLERLGERRDELQQKARDMETRERVMDDAEKKLDERINELKALQEKATAEVAKRQESEALGMKNIIIMYEAMKPKEAARVFDRLPHAVLVPVATQMNPRKMAEVLAAMSPEGAERLTVALANRSKVPNPDAAPARPALPPGELPSIEPPAALRR